MHPLWGEATGRWLSQYHVLGVEIGAGTGLGVALLTGIALWRRWRLAWPWALLALMMLLLAMGPQLRITEAGSAFPGPFLLLDTLPPFRNSSRPALFVVLMLIPVAILVALGLTALRTAVVEHHKSSGRRWRVVLTVLVFTENIVAPWPLMHLTDIPHLDKREMRFGGILQGEEDTRGRRIYHSAFGSSGHRGRDLSGNRPGRTD